MKTAHLIVFLGSLLASSGAFSQAALPTVKVDIKDVKIDSIETRRRSCTLGSAPTNPFVDALEFKYYVSLNAADPVTKKFILLASTINYVNISSKDLQSHAMAFVSPAAISRLLGKTDFTASDIKAVAIEVSYGGQLVGGHNQGAAGKWWDDLSKFSVVDGLLLPKNKTPYAPFWGDYDVDVRAQ